MVSLTMFHESPSESSGGCGSCEAGGGDAPRCGNGLEEVYNSAAVRYGYMKHVGEFTYADGMKFTCGAKVVIQTSRGIESGELVSLSCTGCDKHLSRQQIKTYIENSGPDSYLLENGRILREATANDLAEEGKLRRETLPMKRFAQKRADELKLRLKMVDCEHLLGGERIIFYFMADGRVDFRALVKDLSNEFQTRVKLHQVGARDEARLLADYETCGREVCCKVFLKTLKPITMRMAKLQRSTLDPSKVSGRCGRLKCCLRYEHESYESLDAKLPKIGEKVETAHGFGTVFKRQILTQLVQITPAAAGGPITVVIEDVLARNLTEFPKEALTTGAINARSAGDREPGKPSSGPISRGRAGPKPTEMVGRSLPRTGPMRDAKPPPGEKAGETQKAARSRPHRRRRSRRRRKRSGDESGTGSDNRSKT